jgi:hypothetical protein
MPSVAAWLLARPQNAVLALALTMLVPFLPIISGAILVLLALQQELQRVLVTVALAGLVLVFVILVSGSSPLLALIDVATFWLPILALARIMRATRSLTLTLQLAVIIVMAGMCAFFALNGDPVAFWQEVIASNPVLQSLQLTTWQTALEVSDKQFAGVMTTLFATGIWFSLVGVIMLGYWLYQQLPGKTGEFGRFCDLNFGRVIALLLAISSIVGFAFDVIWIESIAILIFAVFWLQGLAMVHWLHASGFLPAVVLVAAYALTMVLSQYLFPALAILGYTDAWFRFRHRVTKQLK